MQVTAKVYHPSTDKRQSNITSNMAGILILLGLASDNRKDLIAEIHRGFSINVIDKLVHELAISQQALLQTLSLSSATLTRRRTHKQKRLTPQESDRVYRVAVVYRTALELFEGDKQAARDWLKEPAKALGGDSPLQHIDTEAGADDVQDLMGRLEHGVIT
jgi:putative toxin-antitoxin system antitoxin component (TIGR02293 family)